MNNNEQQWKGLDPHRSQSVPLEEQRVLVSWVDAWALAVGLQDLYQKQLQIPLTALCTAL